MRRLNFRAGDLIRATRRISAVCEIPVRLKLFTTDMAYVRVPIKVKVKKESSKKPQKAARRKINAAANAMMPKISANELSESRWSVVTFERCAANGLTYSEAVEKLKNLQAQKISGLCIVTDEAAQRVRNKK